MKDHARKFRNYKLLRLFWKLTLIAFSYLFLFYDFSFGWSLATNNFFFHKLFSDLIPLFFIYTAVSTKQTPSSNQNFVCVYIYKTVFSEIGNPGMTSQEATYHHHIHRNSFLWPQTGVYLLRCYGWRTAGGILSRQIKPNLFLQSYQTLPHIYLFVFHTFVHNQEVWKRLSDLMRSQHHSSEVSLERQPEDIRNTTQFFK